MVPIVSRLAKPIDKKISRIVSHCVYDIATGALRGGAKLPSTREGERVFGAHHLTVLRAYQELVAMGLVRNKPRSGFFVAETSSVRRVGTHRAELERLFEDVAEQVRTRTELSPLAVFRYLLHLAERRAAEAPECAFVECTLTQARWHAEEITDRLGIPCAALTVADVEAGPSRVPRSIRCLLTTSFHVAELAHLREDGALRVVAVPIESSARIVDRIGDAARVEFVSLDLATSEGLARSVGDLLRRPAALHATECQVEELPGFLEQNVGKKETKTRFVLSMSLWETLCDPWIGHADLVPPLLNIHASAWERIGQSLGLPVFVASEEERARDDPVAPRQHGG